MLDRSCSSENRRNSMGYRELGNFREAGPLVEEEAAAGVAGLRRTSIQVPQSTGESTCEAVAVEAAVVVEEAVVETLETEKKAHCQVFHHGEEEKA